MNFWHKVDFGLRCKYRLSVWLAAVAGGRDAPSRRVSTKDIFQLKLARMRSKDVETENIGMMFGAFDRLSCASGVSRSHWRIPWLSTTASRGTASRRCPRRGRGERVAGQGVQGQPGDARAGRIGAGSQLRQPAAAAELVPPVHPFALEAVRVSARLCLVRFQMQITTKRV